MTNGHNYLLSIIITTKNEAVNLPRLLKSIYRQLYRHFELIVIDNYSTDATVQLAHAYTPYVYSHGNERSSQRNFGAKKARGRYLLFLDADMEVGQNVLRDCVTHLNQPGIVGVIIPELAGGWSWFGRVKRVEKLLYLGEANLEAARAFTKTAFSKINGYNETLIAGEDWDLHARIQHLGEIGRISSHIYHYETSFLRELSHKIYYARHITAYAKLHPGTFQKQAGWSRITLLWRKRRILLQQPLTAISLFLVKMFEFILYKLICFIPRAFIPRWLQHR